ncbi:MAG: hypothetical protein J5822_06350, partial [Eubacteriaceae bacterium]|nr:hypothetical protein [Eubacteriaceae bacterium]
MAEFSYPDENDRLTNELIHNDYDREYWHESEERILSDAEDYLIRTFGREELARGAFLDLGCGTGRLIPRFARLFG